MSRCIYRAADTSPSRERESGFAPLCHRRPTSMCDSFLLCLTPSCCSSASAPKGRGRRQPRRRRGDGPCAGVWAQVPGGCGEDLRGRTPRQQQHQEGLRQEGGCRSIEFRVHEPWGGVGYTWPNRSACRVAGERKGGVRWVGGSREPRGVESIAQGVPTSLSLGQPEVGRSPNS